MTAIITRSRWDSICTDYRTGSPAHGTAAILRRTIAKGAVLVPAEVVDRPRLFAFGPVVATPGALAVLSQSGTGRAPLLDRHGEGNWGDLCDDDHDANDQAVRTGERILSAYDVDGTCVWVITDAEVDGPPTAAGLRPRYATTLLLPSEY